MRAIGFGNRGKVGIAKLSCTYTIWIIAFLMHSDSAVYAIINNEQNNIRPKLNRCAKFLHSHLKTAIPGKTQNRFFRVAQFTGNCRGQAISHGARGWGELTAKSSKSPEPMNPDRIISGPVCNNGISVFAAKTFNNRSHLRPAWCFG